MKLKKHTKFILPQDKHPGAVRNVNGAHPRFIARPLLRRPDRVWFQRKEGGRRCRIEPGHPCDNQTMIQWSVPGRTKPKHIRAERPSRIALAVVELSFACYKARLGKVPRECALMKSAAASRRAANALSVTRPKLRTRGPPPISVASIDSDASTAAARTRSAAIGVAPPCSQQLW